MGAMSNEGAAAPARIGTGDTSQRDASLLLSIPACELHQVSGGQQRLLERGELTLSVVDSTVAPVVGTHALENAASAAARAPSAQSTGQPGPYPEGYQPPESGGGRGSASNKGGSDSEGEAAGGKSRGASRIVAAVGGTAWELLPASQTLKVGELTFVFSLPGQDVFYTVVLAADTEEEAVGMLEAILEGVTVYRESEALLGDAEAAAGEAALAEHAYRSSVARGVHSASRALAGGLLATATYAQGGISKGAAYFTPAEPTATPLSVSPGLKKRFRQTERLAGSAASLVNSAVSGLAWAGSKVAGGVLWLTGADKPIEAGENAGMLREVGHAAVVGFTEVWDSMEEAGRQVLLSARDNTASVVRQRYGEDAAEVSVNSMTAAGHGADAWFAARKLGVKTVAKSAAKKTAKGVIHKWAGKDGGPGSRASSSLASGTEQGGQAGSSSSLAAEAAAREAVEDTLRPRILRYFAFFMICSAGVNVLPHVAAASVGNTLGLLDAQQPFMVKAGCSRLQLLLRLEAARERAAGEGAAPRLLALLRRRELLEADAGVAEYALGALEALAESPAGLAAVAEAGGPAELRAFLATTQRSLETEDSLFRARRLLAALQGEAAAAAAGQGVAEQ
ncbi:hypothetical protein ABPG77_005724 [Micractinium sp. CCAP 211/92]